MAWPLPLHCTGADPLLLSAGSRLAREDGAEQAVRFAPVREFTSQLAAGWPCSGTTACSLEVDGAAPGLFTAAAMLCCRWLGTLLDGAAASGAEGPSP